MTTLTYTEKLVVEICPTCHVRHAIPEEMRDRALKDRGPNGKQIYCPNGHTWHYTGKTDAEKLQEQLEQEQRRNARLTSQVDQARADADHQAAVARGYKGAAAKLKKRIGRGVCPCCNRHFENVERHMKSQHPEMITNPEGEPTHV